VRIGIDYTAAVRQGAGIGRYTRNLVRAIADLDQETEYRLFVAGDWGEGDGLGTLPGNFQVRSIPLSDRWLNIIWQRLRLPIPVQLVTGALDLFPSPDFVLPPTGRTGSILTVHDLSFLRKPECFVPGFSKYLEEAVTRAVGRAAHILADSESTRQDLIELLKVRPERVTVVYPGVEERFRPTRDPEVLGEVRLKYDLPERFVLSVGTIQPRKNFTTLVEAFGGLVAGADGEGSVSDLHLVVAGQRGWMYEETFNAVERHELGDCVHFLGYVDDPDLPAIYSLASAFAFPTLYEGFGLPVLEAMACGTPVVTADNSSLPEVVGDAGLLVEASDAQALAASLSRVLSDGQLRRRLQISGLERSKQFRWSGAGASVLELYRRVRAESLEEGAR
jgi:glycosyltransferase involved in cell wall biosynthesis